MSLKSLKISVDQLLKNQGNINHIETFIVSALVCTILPTFYEINVSSLLDKVKN